MQRKSLNSDFTEASEDKDEDFEELEQTPKKSVKELREEWLKKFDDENRARRKENLGMSYADELEKEIGGRGYSPKKFNSNNGICK